MYAGTIDGNRGGARRDQGPTPSEEPAPRVEVPAAVTHRELSWEELLAEAERVGPDTRFAGLSDEDVVERLAVGAAQIDAAMCRWLELLAELVVRGVWAAQGARTPGAWLSWRLGVAPSTAREQVRVALRLREFPATRDRFAAGTLSYSKVRAVTRCGDPSCEALLLAWADDATAQQMEAIARGFRTAEKAKRDAAELGEDAEVVCSLRSRSPALGRRELTIVGPDEVIAAIEDDLHRLAEVLVADRLGAEVPGGDRAREVDGEDDLDGCAGAAPRPRQRSGADLVEALATTLAAAAAADTPPDTTGLDRHTIVLHASADDVASGGTAPAEALVAPSGSAAVGGAAPRNVVAVTDDHRRVRGMDRRSLRRLACDAGIVLVVEGRDGTPLDVGRRTRRTTAAIRRALQRRDRGCTFPGCAATRHLHAHHVVFWADGGPTNLSNLVLLCAFHHRFVHAHDWRITVRADGRHRYAPAPDAPPVERIGAPVGASAEAVALAAPKSASAEALSPATYDGSPYDLDVAVAVLQRHHEAVRQHTAVAA